MTDTNNPHLLTDEENKKLVSYQALKRYHHNLIYALGLVQDTGAYKYDGERWVDADGNLVEKGTEGANPEWDTAQLNVSKALDKLYDMCKEGAIEFKTGYDEDADKTVNFSKEGDNENNIYYINAKVGDNVVNIALDANDFVKDRFLKKVEIVTVKTEGETQTITSNKGVFDKTAFKDQFEEAEPIPDGVYFFYTWLTKTGEKTPVYEQNEDGSIKLDDKNIPIPTDDVTNPDEYDYSVIALKDIYGDLKGDDYITFDVENTQIKAQVASVEKVTDVTTYSYSLNNAKDLHTALTNAGVDFTVDNETGKVIITNTTLTETGLQEIINQASITGVNITKTGTREGTGETSWKVDSTDENNLATAENLAEVANAIEKKNTLTDGVVELSTSTTETHSLTANVTDDGSSYELKLIITDDTDIDNLFVECTPTPTTYNNIQQNVFNTDENGEANIDNATQTDLGITDGNVTQIY